MYFCSVYKHAAITANKIEIDITDTSANTIVSNVQKLNIIENVIPMINKFCHLSCYFFIILTINLYNINHVNEKTIIDTIELIKIVISKDILNTFDIQSSNALNILFDSKKCLMYASHPLEYSEYVSCEKCILKKFEQIIIVNISIAKNI